MKPLTFLSGVLLIGAGAFTFFFYVNGFVGVAFILGLMMFLAGLIDLLVYVMSGSKRRLPDTLLVEGAVDLLLGFTVLNDQITDNTMTLFFGIWILVAGVCRVAQSFAVSRINGRQWFAVVPLALIATLQGVIMLMMPALASVNSLFWVAFAFILNGFSIILYSLFMTRKLETPKAVEARERAEARQMEISEKRARRNALRKLSKDDRKAILADERARAEREAAELREAKQAAKEARRAARNKDLDSTVKLSESEVAAIREADAAAKDESPQEAVPAAPQKEPAEVPSPAPARAVSQAVAAEQDPEVAEELRSKRGIINLARVEAEEPPVVFETPELPDVEKVSAGGESSRRGEILDRVDATKLPAEEEANFTPLTLEELFADESFHINPLKGKEAEAVEKRLTQTFTFDWLEKDLQPKEKDE